MTGTWINLPTQWSLASVRAGLNVVIAVLGTIGIWSFSRYWWRRGTAGVLLGKREIPLSTLCTVSGPGDGWDAVIVLRKRLLALENWRLLFQLVFVLIATLACMFAGPLAQRSTRSIMTARETPLDVLLATADPYSPSGNMLSAEELWNETITSLDDAKFPEDKLLDFLPPSEVPWTYVASDWDHTWTMNCHHTPETVLHNVTSSGNGTFYYPLDAYPAFRDTIDPSWLNTSEYRVQSDFCSWSTKDDPPFKDVFFFVLIESDPAKNDRMLYNNDTLRMSISLFHARNFSATDHQNIGEGSAPGWRPYGPVANASYTRAECNITRKADVRDANHIPWPWTNDTYSLTMGYWTYSSFRLQETSAKKEKVVAPTSHDLMRFYQAYMASIDTLHAVNTTQKVVSVWTDTPQISVFMLTVLIVVLCATIWSAGQYYYFLWKHRSKLEEMCIPDSKMEWMIRAAKIAYTPGELAAFPEKPRDRDYLRAAAVGNGGLNEMVEADGPPSLGIARVYSSKNLTSSSTTFGTMLGRGRSRDSKASDTPRFILINNKRSRRGDVVRDMRSPSITVAPCDASEQAMYCCETDSTNPSHDPVVRPDGVYLRPESSRKMSKSKSPSSSKLSSPRSSFQSIVPEEDEIEYVEEARPARREHAE